MLLLYEIFISSSTCVLVHYLIYKLRCILVVAVAIFTVVNVAVVVVVVVVMMSNSRSKSKRVLSVIE